MENKRRDETRNLVNELIDWWSREFWGVFKSALDKAVTVKRRTRQNNVERRKSYEVLCDGLWPYALG
jgi:hypothetical protein